jgi:hypothetical protein
MHQAAALLRAVHPKLCAAVLLQAYGPRGKEPTRYGDWEIKGRCTDFS